MAHATTLIVFTYLMSTVAARLYLPAVSIDLRTGNYTPSVFAKGLTWVSPVTPNFNNTRCDREGVLKLSYSSNKARMRAQIIMEFSNSIQKMAFDIGDSESNNGWGGDAGSQSNNAEVHAYGDSIYFYGKDIPAGGSYGLLYSRENYLGKKVVINIGNEVVSVFNMTNLIYLNAYSLFALKGQPDSLGRVNYDLYLGMNRGIGKRSESGSGLCSVVVTWFNYPHYTYDKNSIYA